MFRSSLNIHIYIQVKGIYFRSEFQGAHLPKVYFQPAETETIAGAKVKPISKFSLLVSQFIKKTLTDHEENVNTHARQFFIAAADLRNIHFGINKDSPVRGQLELA